MKASGTLRGLPASGLQPGAGLLLLRTGLDGLVARALDRLAADAIYARGVLVRLRASPSRERWAPRQRRDLHAPAPLRAGAIAPPARRDG